MSSAIEMVESPESDCVLLCCCEKRAPKNNPGKEGVMLSHNSQEDTAAMWGQHSSRNMRPAWKVESRKIIFHLHIGGKEIEQEVGSGYKPSKSTSYNALLLQGSTS